MHAQRPNAGRAIPPARRAPLRKYLVQTLFVLVGTAGLPLPQQSGAAAGEGFVPLQVVGDGVPEPLSRTPGDARRGRALILARDAASCVLCHAIADPAIRFAGNVGPALDGVGGKLSVAQLRLRVADSLRLSAATIMPSYYRTQGLDRVAVEYRGKPILEAQEIEDIVAYLATLK